MPRRVLVIGNGSIAFGSEGTAFVHVHNAGLLADLKALGLSVAHAARPEIYDPQRNFHNTDISKSGVEIISAHGLVGAVKLGLSVLQADLVYLFFPGTLPTWVAILCRLLRKPYGLYVRGERFASEGAEGYAVRGAAFAHTVSPLLTNALAKLGVESHTARPMLSLRPDDIGRFSRPSRVGAFRLLFVGNLLPDKGLRELVEAVTQLRDHGRDVTLRIVGGGSLIHELEADIKKRGLGETITLVGLVTDKDQLLREYADADAFVLPTYHEGFPRVLYEAMSQRLPIITTMVGGIPGRMQDHKNCLAIMPRDVSSIVKAVETLVDNPDLALQLAESGVETATMALSGHDTQASLIETWLRGRCVS